jgi:protein phosphatase
MKGEIAMQYWALTDPGCVRSQNQDAYKIEKLDSASLLCVVCDGMGGAKSGNIASTLAADVFCHSVTASWKPGMGQEAVDALLRSAVKLANFTVYDQALEFVDFAGMGTTLVAVLVQGKMATVVNVGDSRLYHVAMGQIRQVTKDHSLVQMMVDRGELTLQDAKSYPGKNMITRAVGTETAVQCDVFHLLLGHGDAVLLCTDGLSNLLDEQEILFEVVYEENGQRCCERLLEIAENRGAPDNVTCVLMKL